MILMPIENWGAYKLTVLTNKKLSMQFSMTATSYLIYAAENQTFVWTTELQRGSEEAKDFETNYLALANQPLEAIDPVTGLAYKPSSPFAVPTYRTKLDAAPAWQTCAENDTTTIDFLLTAERFVSGGEILFKDTKEGDYITASVYDKDSVIPEAYRASLCEAHPIVAEYVIKRWLLPVTGYSRYDLDTRPLNAKITAGLYLRVSYVATSETGSRKIAVNYDLTKKL